MAEAPRGRVTITLGRGGSKVVKRADVSDVGFSDSRLASGSKRSVRDRLGSNVDSSLMHGGHINNKRQRDDFGANGVDDGRISKDDLRLKLMRKNGSRRAQNDDNNVDLREKLLRTERSISNSHTAHQHMPESREASYIAHQRMPESREAGVLGRFPPMRGMDGFPRMESSRSSYSPWTLEHIRRRSPDTVRGNSRGLSPPRNVEEMQRPPRNVEELQRRPVDRTYDDVRGVQYMSKDGLQAPRPMAASPFVAKPTMPTPSAKPAAPGPPLPNQVPQRTLMAPKPPAPYPGEVQVPQTVDGLLHALGLEKYSLIFRAEEVDMAALKQMGEHDLKELGIPMGPRKKIVLALMPRNKRPPMQLQQQQ